MSGDPRNLSEFTTLVRAEPEIERPAAGSLEHRASIAFKGLAFLYVAGIVLAMFPPATLVSNLLTVTFSLAAALAAIVVGATARGLDRRRPWAVAAVRPLLVALAISGVGTVLLVLAGGRMRVPFDGLLAIWALLGARDDTLVPGDGRRAAIAVSGGALLLAAMLLAHPLFGWGGVFDVHEPDLVVQVEVDCGPAGRGAPPRVSVTYEWRWTTSSPLPNGTDIAVISWAGRDAQGRALYVIDEIPDSADGIYSGLAGYPSTPMADQIARESDASYRWGIELEERGHQRGQVELQLRRPREAPAEPTTLTVTGWYVHLGLWRQGTTVTCSW